MGRALTIDARLIERRTELQWVEGSCKKHAHTHADRAVTVGLVVLEITGGMRSAVSASSAERPLGQGRLKLRV